MPRRPVCRRRAWRARDEGRADDGRVQPLVDQLRHAAAVGDLLDDAARRAHRDLPLRPQHRLEHEPQRLREAGARPRELRLHELPAGPRRRRRGDAASAQREEQRHEQAEHERDPDRRQRSRAGQTQGERRGHRHRPRREPRERRDEQPGDDAEHDAGAGERDDCRAHRERALRVASATDGAPRRSEQDEPDDLDEAEDREGGRGGERGERDRAGQPVAEPAVRRHVHERLQRQPLGGEAVERRHAGDRERADEEGAAGPRHAAQKPAEPVELERADRPLEGAGAEEEQRLEHGVVERVQQRRRERERRPRVGAARAQQQAGAEPEHDDPDVLDRVEREQALEVVLEERVHDAADRRERAEREHEHAEPQRQHTQPVDEHTHEAVDRDLDHHAAHQRRHRRGRDRMRARQPAVQRHHARLRPHADERGQRDRDLEAGAAREDVRATERRPHAQRAGRRSRCRRRRYA